jgi:hypothetical protein
MPGPVRYSKSGKVKKSTPRKYESGRGWSKLTPTKQATPAASKARKGEVRRAVSRGDFGRQFARSPRTRIDTPDTREINREALGPVGDALATVARKLSEPADLPGTRFDKLAEVIALLTPGGVVKGATVKGVSGLKSAVPVREAAKKTVSRRQARAKKAANRPARRSRARANRRRFAGGKGERRNEEYMERMAYGDRTPEEPAWLGKPELKQRVEEMKYWRKPKR